MFLLCYIHELLHVDEYVGILAANALHIPRGGGRALGQASAKCFRGVDWAGYNVSNDHPGYRMLPTIPRLQQKSEQEMIKYS